MIVYTDLDGTMLGRRGSLIHTSTGDITLEPTQAIASLHEHSIPLVLVSGRTRKQLVEVAALTGADGFIAELGALVAWDGWQHSQVLSGAAPPPLICAPPELVEEMLAHFEGHLDMYLPWSDGHEVDILLRGRIDPLAVEAWLASKGFGWLRMRDNGVLPESVAGARLTGTGPVHVFHLIPDGISKGLAIQWDLERRGIDPASAIAVGDSASDLEMAPFVGRFFLVANGAMHPHMQPLIAQHDNITVTDGLAGAGFVEAVHSLLDKVRV